MTDYYFSSSSYDILAAMIEDASGCAPPSSIGPIQGRTAIAERTEDGVTVPEVPAVGDPDLWYAAIRTDEEIPPPAGTSVCDAPTAIAVLGVWA
ncbi:MAG: hypothetical protein PHE27_04260 [Alphaproteobacteria bacterium]|nr:hypothetical protein [Alphaproteobacteria bacterium]